MTDEQERALRALDAAATGIRKQVSGKAATGIENTYGQAYQLCVRLGVRPQIRAKYR